MQQRLPKFRRAPDALPTRKITDASIALLDLVARYHFLPTSLLVRLSEWSKNITHRHLQMLFHRSLVNRFSFPRVGNPGEFHYYLDSSAAMTLLGREGDLDLLKVVKRNRAKRYADVHDLARVEEMQGKLLFLKHEVMISRFHAILELACRQSKGRVELVRFWQGAPIWRSLSMHSLEPGMRRGEFVESAESAKVALRPDALFTLRFPMEPEGRNRAHFFYEADRETESSARMISKLRTYHEYLMVQRRQEADFSIKRVRGVLIETLTAKSVEGLRRSATQPIVAGAKPSSLFWFASSDQFSADEPSRVFGHVWLPPAGSLRLSLSD